MFYTSVIYLSIIIESVEYRDCNYDTEEFCQQKTRIHKLLYLYNIPKDKKESCISVLLLV